MELGTKVTLMSLYFVLNRGWRFRHDNLKICRCRPWAKLPLNASGRSSRSSGRLSDQDSNSGSLHWFRAISQLADSFNKSSGFFSRSHRFFLFFDRKLSRMFTFSCENEIYCINIFEITQTFAELNNVKSRQGSAEKKK